MRDMITVSRCESLVRVFSRPFLNHRMQLSTFTILTMSRILDQQELKVQNSTFGLAFVEFGHHQQGDMPGFCTDALQFLLFYLFWRAAHANQYMLKGNQTDACFQPSLTDFGECLQGNTESYYGKHLTMFCSGFP